MIAEIMGEMENPAEFPKALWGSAPFILLAYIIVGIGGYYYRGNLVTGMIQESMPFGVWYCVAAFCLVVHMGITWMIRGTVVGHAIYKWVGWGDANKNDDVETRRWWAVLLGVMLLISWFVADLVPFVDDLVDLFGSLFMPYSCFIVPILMYCRWMWDYGEERDAIGKLEMYLIAVELVFTVVIFFVGTVFNTRTIYDNWESYGWPFQCHCTDIWSTCACSSDNLAMAYCDAT